jgi:hypothetical protein
MYHIDKIDNGFLVRGITYDPIYVSTIYDALERIKQSYILQDVDGEKKKLLLAADKLPATHTLNKVTGAYQSNIEQWVPKFKVGTKVLYLEYYPKDTVYTVSVIGSLPGWYLIKRDDGAEYSVEETKLKRSKK